MKATLLISLVSLVTAATLTSAADDIRSKVAGEGRIRLRSVEIDPDASIYGVPFGTSEDDFIKACGNPSGYLRLNDRNTALVYGRAHAFLFETGALMGVRITGQILDWKLVNEFQDWTRFDSRDSRLNTGVFMGMDLKQVRKLLGDRLSSGEYGRRYYTAAKARVELDFSHYTNEGEGDEAYKLQGIFVKHGASAEGVTRFPRVGGGLGASSPGGTERFGGIGVMLHENADTGELEIAAVTPNSPADKAELRKGLFIRSIDDMPTEGKELRENVQLMRGDAGSTVKLEVFDPKTDRSRTVELTRAEIVYTGSELKGRTNITVTSDQVLRLEAANGARAVIQFLCFTHGGFGSGDRQDSATYRWRFKASESASVVAGTNTAVDSYTSKLVGANRYELTPKGSREDAKAKAGDIAVEWSYGYTNKGSIHFNPTKLKASVQDQGTFDTGP